MSVELWGAEPPRDCPLCPRLVAYRQTNQAQNPDWWNGPAPSFGDPQARLLVAGLAPGRTGANRTGRPFTGDHAGWMLYDTLTKTGFANGKFDARVGHEPADTVRTLPESLPFLLSEHLFLQVGVLAPDVFKVRLKLGIELALRFDVFAHL